MKSDRAYQESLLFTSPSHFALCADQQLSFIELASEAYWPKHLRRLAGRRGIFLLGGMDKRS